MSDYDELLQEMRLIRALLMARVLEGMTQRDSISLLANVGLRPRDIADAIGTTPGTVNVALTALRKEGRVKKRG